MPSKRSLYFVLIAAACVTALIAIVAVVIGNLDDTTGRILFSCLVVATFAATALEAVVLHERNGSKAVIWITIAASVVGLFVSLGLTWFDSLSDTDWAFQLAFCLLTVALGGALAAVTLLLNRESDSRAVSLLVRVTLSLLAVGTLMTVFAIATLTDAEIYYRLLAVVAVLWVLGTFVSPIVRRIQRPPITEPAAL